jgi:hypothetical protein
LLVVADPPVVGAALLGLDALGAKPGVHIAARAALLVRTRTAPAHLPQPASTASMAP